MPFGGYCGGVAPMQPQRVAAAPEQTLQEVAAAPPWGRAGVGPRPPTLQGDLGGTSRLLMRYQDAALPPLTDSEAAWGLDGVEGGGSNCCTPPNALIERQGALLGQAAAAGNAAVGALYRLQRHMVGGKPLPRLNPAFRKDAPAAPFALALFVDSTIKRHLRTAAGPPLPCRSRRRPRQPSRCGVPGRRRCQHPASLRRAAARARRAAAVSAAAQWGAQCAGMVAARGLELCGRERSTEGRLEGRQAASKGQVPPRRQAAA